MAEVKAFKALRFTEKAGDINELVCPPYDIISDSQRKEYLEKNPDNIIRLELRGEGTDPYAEAAKVLWYGKRTAYLKGFEKGALYL